MRYFILFFLFTLSVHAQQYTPLVEIAVDGDAEAAAVVISKGADVEQLDTLYRSPLMIAATYNTDPKMIHVLLSNGADPNRRHQQSGQTALFYAVRYNKNPDVISTLIAGGASLEMTDINNKHAVDYLHLNKKLRSNQSVVNMLNPDFY